MSYMRDRDGTRLDDIAIPSEQVWAESSFAGSTLAGVLNTPVLIDGCMALVPPSDRPQEVRLAVTFNITVTGGGLFTLQLYDYTAGNAVLVAYTNAYIPTARPTTAAGDRVRLVHRVDPHDDYRVMQGYFTLGRDAGSSLQMGVPNLGSGYTKSAIQVVAA